MVDTASLALFGDDAAEARRLRVPLRYRLLIVEAHKIEADQRRLERRRIDDAKLSMTSKPPGLSARASLVIAGPSCALLGT